MTGRNKEDIPIHLLESLRAYGSSGRRTGECLRALLANDFMEGVGRADEATLAALPAIAIYIHNEMPGRCHGSYAVYDAWLAYNAALQEAAEGMSIAQKLRIDELRDDCDVAKRDAYRQKYHR